MELIKGAIKVLYETAKIAKSGGIVFSIHGTFLLDGNPGYARIITENPLIDFCQHEPIVFSVDDINSLRKEKVSEIDITMLGNTLILRSLDGKNAITSMDRRRDPIAYQYFGEYQMKLHSLGSVDFNNLSLDIKDLRKNQDFEDIIAMKSAEGAGMLKVTDSNSRDYYMILFSRIIPVNKSDEVSLSIYNSYGATFIGKFSIHKKPVHLTVYIRFLHLNQQL